MKFLIALIIIAAAVLYVRGSMRIMQQQGSSCTWHILIVTCVEKQPKLPSFMDAMKAGVKFDGSK